MPGSSADARVTVGHLGTSKSMPILRFGVFEVDCDSGDLRTWWTAPPSEQLLRLLLALVNDAGQVVTREQLRRRLWPEGTFVGFDRAINKAVSELRDVLGDSAFSPRFIETLSKRGYRFVHPLEEAPSGRLSTWSEAFNSDAERTCVIGRYRGVDEPSPICIRASDTSRMRSRLMIAARRPMLG